MPLKWEDAIESEYAWVFTADDVVTMPCFILKLEDTSAFPAFVRWFPVSDRTAFPTFQQIFHIFTP
jgi:hypothetical protein